MNNPNLPNWPATFCAANIILAIGCSVLVTHATILKNANEKCLENLVSNVNCQEEDKMPSCKLEKYILVTDGCLYIYSMLIGFNSVFWLIHSCCRAHFQREMNGRVQNRQNELVDEDDRSTLHVCLNAFGGVSATICIITLVIFTLHCHFLMPTIQFLTSSDQFQYEVHNGTQDCLNFFKDFTWNAISLITLFICLGCHGCLIARILLSKSDLFKKDNPAINVAFIDEGHNSNIATNRVRIPSARYYPSSPIALHLNTFDFTPNRREKNENGK